MNIAKWFHHLFDPHCRECALEREEAKICPSCETLKEQLKIAVKEKETFMDAVITMARPPEAPAIPLSDLKPLGGQVRPWRVQRQMLEEEDRIKAATMRRVAEQEAKLKNDATPTPGIIRESKSIEELEKELGVVNEVRAEDTNGSQAV